MLRPVRSIRWLLPLCLALACGGRGKGQARADNGLPAPGTGTRLKSEVPGGPDAPPVVIFAVLDTVRADHTSLCGYDRPTTPVLQDMVAKGAAHTCRGYSPAPWTHPSHASFFTGKSVVEHHAIWVTDSSVSINPVTRVRPLADSFETAAELFKASGYQTVAISANMIITPPSGLLQGFDQVVVADEAIAFRGEKHMRQMKEVFAGLDKTKPLFLFLNFYDAHDPYPPVPKGIDWVPQQAAEDLHPNQHDKEHPYFKYVKGLSTPAEEAKFLRRVRNGYDWGVHQADAGLGNALQMLIDDGWLANGFRIAVTADHGELLGEHRLLRHGGFLFEQVVNVPILFYDSTEKKQVQLPEPASGIWVHDLLLYGRLPDAGPPVHAVSEPNEQDILIGALGGAIWAERDKLVCSDGDRGWFNLEDDPMEVKRKQLQGHPGAPQLKELCTKVALLHQLPPPDANPDLEAALKAVGYVEAE